MSLSALVLSFLHHGPNIFLYPGAFDPYPREIILPSQYGLPYEELTLTTSDRVKIRAYLLLQPKEDADSPTKNGSDIPERFNDSTGPRDSKKPAQRPTVLMFHGNADNIGYIIPLAHVFYARMRCHVLMLSPRGFGKSEGRPSTKGLIRDSEAALEFIVGHPTLSKTPIVLYGQSMGGALAIELAGRHAARIRALIIENTYLSLRLLIPEVMPIFSSFAPFFRQWNSVARIAQMPESLPILMLSGLCDEVIPPKHMKGLWDAAHPQGSKREGMFEEFAKGSHNDTWDQPGYWDAIHRFIDNLERSS